MGECQGVVLGWSEGVGMSVASRGTCCAHAQPYSSTYTWCCVALECGTRWKMHPHVLLLNSTFEVWDWALVVWLFSSHVGGAMVWRLGVSKGAMG